MFPPNKYATSSLHTKPELGTEKSRPVTDPCMRTLDTRTWKAELKSLMHCLWSKFECRTSPNTFLSKSKKGKFPILYQRRLWQAFHIAFLPTLSLSTITMNGKKLFRVNPAYIQLNNVPRISENTFNFALPSTSESVTCTLSQKQRSKNLNFSSPEVSKSQITNLNTSTHWQEPQTPIATSEHSSTVNFGMLTPLIKAPTILSI